MSAREIKKIHFVEYNARINTLMHAKLFPKYGTPLLATIMKEKGYDVKMYLDGVSRMTYEDMIDCDCLCLPLVIPAYNKVKDFTERVKKDRPDLPVIIGGPTAIMYPDRVIDICDYTIRCEGDEVLPELVAVLNTGGDVSRVRGISFKQNGRVVDTPDREPPEIPKTIPDYSLIHGFRRATRGPGRLYNLVNTLQTSRGCHFRCAFCPTPQLFGYSFRNRDIDSVIADIKHKQQYNDWFLVVDNSFFGNRQKVRDLLNRLIEEDLGAELTVFERHEIGFDEEMLDLMRRAGVRCLIVGVESLTDENLKAFHKKQTTVKALESIYNIKRHGIHVIGTFAFGFGEDTREKAEELAGFIKKSGLSLNVFILHDVHMEEDQDLIIPLDRRFMTYYQQTDPENSDHVDYATGSFITYFPEKMKPSTLQKCMIDIYKQVYTHRYILSFLFRKNVFESLMGIVHGYGIRRMNKSIERICENYYYDYLKQIEDGLYDENETLINEKLKDLDGLPIPAPIQERVDMVSNNPLIMLVIGPPFLRYVIHKVRHRLGKLFSTRQGRQLPAH